MKKREPKKLKREKKTLEAMIRLYCRENHHNKQQVCQECQELLNYAYTRVEKCPLGDKKTTCAKCSIHCFKPEYKDKIKLVMRYSGPKMAYQHPLLALFHLLDSRPKERKK